MKLALALFVSCISIFASEYASGIEKWRTEREARLKAPDGWLSVAGLFWLKPGVNTVGSEPGSRVTLPSGSAKAGIFRLDGDRITYEASGAQPKELRPDKPDYVETAGVKLYIIHRGQRYGVRMRDNNSPIRTGFTKLRWFPVEDTWRVTAKYVPYPQPRKVLFDSLTGDKQEVIIPGYVEFTRGKQTTRLTPSLEDEELFFVFRDTTAGKSTYPAARFLYAKAPTQAGPVELDFNKAYNPPCAFTPYATCPLPPKENRLPFPIEAGEMKYEGPPSH